MKNYISVRIIVAILSSFVLLTGCTDATFTYSFRQDLGNVEKVEICAYDSYHETRMPLVELDNQDANALMSEISALSCYKFFPGDHPRSYGKVIISITYSDGEIELIGMTNIGWITPNGVSCLSSYFFNHKDIYTLLVKYVDAELLPDLSEYSR